MVITPLRSRVYMMWSWAVLMPTRTRRSLIAHFMAPITTRKSAMISSPKVAGRGLTRVAILAVALTICVT